MLYATIRWQRRAREFACSPRVQVALMTASMLVVTIAGSAGKRWY